LAGEATSGNKKHRQGCTVYRNDPGAKPGGAKGRTNFQIYEYILRSKGVFFSRPKPTAVGTRTEVKEVGGTILMKEKGTKKLKVSGTMLEGAEIGAQFGGGPSTFRRVGV